MPTGLQALETATFWDNTNAWSNGADMVTQALAVINYKGKLVFTMPENGSSVSVDAATGDVTIDFERSYWHYDENTPGVAPGSAEEKTYDKAITDQWEHALGAKVTVNFTWGLGCSIVVGGASNGAVLAETAMGPSAEQPGMPAAGTLIWLSNEHPLENLPHEFGHALGLWDWEVGESSIGFTRITLVPPQAIYHDPDTHKNVPDIMTYASDRSVSSLTIMRLLRGYGEIP